MTAAPPPGAAFEAAAAFWHAQPFFQTFGIRLEALEEGRARLVMHRNETNVAGVRDSLNGGLQATFAEVAAHIALGTVLRPGSRIERTQDVGISYLTSATGARTVAEARVLRAGRTSVVAVDIVDGDDGTMRCAARVSCRVERDGS